MPGESKNILHNNLFLLSINLFIKIISKNEFKAVKVQLINKYCYSQKPEKINCPIIELVPQPDILYFQAENSYLLFCQLILGYITK